MKVLCDGLELSEAVLTVGKAISGRTTNPVLEGICLQAKSDALILTATDTDLTIEKTLKAEVLMEGETVVLGRTFGEFVKKLEGEQVELSYFDGFITVRYGESESVFPTFNVEDFPKIEKNVKENTFTVKNQDFIDVVEKTVYACAVDDSRPILKGALLEIEGEELTAVALDGFRMAVIKKDLESSSGSFSTIVPARTLLEITRLLEKTEDTLTVAVQKNTLLVSVKDTVLISRLIEGEFIKYKQIMPSEFLTNFRVNRELLVRSLERASVIARSDKMNIVRLDVKDEFLNVSAKTEIGTITENIAVNTDGKDLVIAFNGKYLLDYLKTLTDEFVELHLNSAIDPCIVSAMGKEDYKYLLVPLRVSA